jgi:hypothetical protein
MEDPMMQKLLILICGGVLAGSLLSVSPPAQALHPGGDVYSSEPYNVPYKFKDKCADLKFEVKGRAKGYETIYNVPGSDGQAFLDDNRNSYREVWTNTATGRKAHVSGKSRFREVKATHVKGDVWLFRSFLSGAPLVVKNDKGHVAFAEWGVLVVDTTFDTLGDSQPGGEPLDEEVVSSRGHWPTWEPDFDFCDLVRKVLG